MIPDEDNVPKILKEDTKAKKIVVNSSRSKPSKSKPLPSAKEVAKKSGEVITIGLYDELVPYKQFANMPKDERRKAINAYLLKYSRKDIAKFWDKNIQGIHDLVYKLNKPVAPPTKDAVEEVAEEIVPAIKVEEIYPFDLKIIREISGERIQDYIVKLVDLFELDNDLIVVLDLKRSGAGFFNIRIKVNTIMPARQFADELLNNIGLLPRNDTFLMSLCVKEKKKESQ